MLRGTRRPVEDRAIPEKKISVSVGLHNRFDIEVLDAATGELKQKAQAFNVICDTLWNQIFSSYSNQPAINAYFKYILFGSGSGTPAATDTTLFSRLGAKNNWSDYTRVFRPAQSMGYTQAVITLQAEEYVGSTITEVGIGYDSTHCVTHAMLEDMNGNPISITKTDTDVIKIYATIYLHWTTGGAYGGMLNLSRSINYNMSLLSRLTGSTYYGTAFWKAEIYRTSRSNVLQGTISPVISLSTSMSTAQRKVTFSGRIPAGERNDPIMYLEIYGISNASDGNPNYVNDYYLAMGSWFTPPQIAAEAVGTGDGTAQDFSTAFPVKTAGTVYVDGVAASGVTVRTGPANGAALQSWLMLYYTIASGNPYFNTSFSPITVDDAGRINLPGLTNGTGYYFFNPYAATGVGKVELYNSSYTSEYAVTFRVDMSADGSTWTEAGSVTYARYTAEHTTKTVVIPAALQHLPYMRIRMTDYAGSSAVYNFYFSASAPGENLSGNIHFDTPPAAGSVITADYTPDCIAKDSNHVFDLTLELTLGEYQEV